MFKISRVLGLVLALSVAQLGGCKKNHEDDGQLMVFHGSHQDDIKTLDPANAYDTISWDIVPSIYDTLYQYAYLDETYRVVPLLAADMPKYSADRLTVTIPIKHGVKFHDDPAFKETNGKGRELKARDFLYGWKRLALPSLQSQGWWLWDGKIVGANEFHDKLLKATKGTVPKLFEEEIEGFKAIDDYTLQIKLKKPYPQLQYVLVMPFTAPVPKEAITAYGDENGNLSDHPIGTGPFVLKEWRRGHRVVLERNPSYHPDFYPTDGSVEFRKRGLLADAGRPLPFLDRIVIDVIKERQPEWLNFLKGQIDVMLLPKDNFSQAITNQVNLTPELEAKGIRLSIDVGLAYYYVDFNFRDKVIGGNKYLRQAISAAIDREAWIQTFTNGRGRKMVSMLPPGVADRPKESKIKYDFNLPLAKELLKKAGYPEGKGLPALNFDMRGADSLSRQMGEFFTQQLAAVGIKLNVIYNTFPAYLEKAKQGNLTISYGGWFLDYPDAENSYQLLYGPNRAPGPNGSNYENPAFDKLYEQIAVMESGPKRAALIQQIEDHVQEEVPWANGYFVTNYELSQPWLFNYRASDMILNKYKYYRINRDVKKRYLEAK